MPPFRRQQVLGWLAVVISTGIAGFWAFWGAIENFHEGWYLTSFWQNLALMFGQYLMPMLIFVLMGTLSVRWPKIGARTTLLAVEPQIHTKYFSARSNSENLAVSFWRWWRSSTVSTDHQPSSWRKCTEYSVEANSTSQSSHPVVTAGAPRCANADQ